MSRNARSLRTLAELFLTAEAAKSPDLPHPKLDAFEKLRGYLTRLVGAYGYAALQRRALTLARAEVPSLRQVTVMPDGGLNGIEELEGRDEALTAVTAHLLGLLIDLIGESLTLRLMFDAFPNLSSQTMDVPEDLL